MRNKTERAALARCCGFALMTLAAALPITDSSAAAEGSDADSLRVCADPNNLPFSDEAGRGFENKIAELIGRQLGKLVAYTWWAQRRGFVRNTLNAGLCDVVVGVPAKLDMVATTRPYYRSTYVFVSRADRKYGLRSMKDPRLHRLAVGVQLIGSDGFNTPPAQALGELGVVGNLVGYTVYGDYRDASPAARIIEAVENGKVDVAAAWGPLAGYFAKLSSVPLTIAPIGDTEDFKPLLFQFDIAVGVRKQDQALRAQIDAIVEREAREITEILESYGVPLVK
jgi:mxaJ protein